MSYSINAGPPASLAAFGALIGDPVRAAILLRLSDGSRRPAGELAECAGVSPQACSAHLAQLVGGGLLSVEPEGRHRFYRIASGDVAELLEDVASRIGAPPRRPRHDPRLCAARLCYDHLAGRLGVAVFDGLVGNGLLLLGSDGPSVSPAGSDWFRRLGIDPAATARGRRPLVRLCLDWTERRQHLGGRLGAALAARFFEDALLSPGGARRSLRLTPRGATLLRTELGITLPDLA